ncbi:MAG TPA: PilT/PilU family type 4a pilus ATPase, partial [Elusimicrobiota bacterium]|nr:PilT/PilU family type 4a pilus ATPase [Elusimicrobiota bacterium]
RVIPSRIPSPEELMLPPVVTSLTELHRGLVLVTGPTGSGKTTTLASLINIINQKRRANIVTIEDPIEFIYSNRSSVVSQREIGLHSPSFASALKYVLRQDPDVVLIGELRDFETIAAALTVAETGHLVFATLHTVDAAQSIDRVIDVFPSRQQQQVRTQLAGVLKAVIAQTLIPRSREGGRVAAREIMIVTPAVANLVRQGKTHELYSAIEMGANHGMISLDRSLDDLVKRGLIDSSEALSRTNNPDVIKARSAAGMGRG